MANVVTVGLDPALLTQQAVAGSAQLASNPQAAFWAQLFAAANNSGAGVEVLDTTATTLSLLTYRSDLKVAGTMAFTVPNGTVEGQTKVIRAVTATATPAATVTVTTPDATVGYACPATFFFDTVGQQVTLQWTTTAGTAAWRVIGIVRAGGTANNVVVGTTVLSQNPLWATFYASVTGTVASTTTKGIPNGSMSGDLISVQCSTAATIPSGTISLTALTLVGAASTTLGTFGATTNLMVLRWNGIAWEQRGASVTLALS